MSATWTSLVLLRKGFDSLTLFPGLTCNAMQALLITAAGSDGRAKEHLSQRNAKEQQALDIALQGKQWHAVQLLVTARMTCFPRY